MSTYQPWLSKYLEIVQHNTAVMNYLAKDIALKYHAHSPEIGPSLVCLLMSELQLLDQTTHLISLLGELYNLWANP